MVRRFIDIYDDININKPYLNKVRMAKVQTLVHKGMLWKDH